MSSDKFKVRTINAHISDFVGLNAIDISKKYRTSQVTVTIVDYRVLELVTLLVISPLEHVWRFIHIDGSDGEWLVELGRQADAGLLQEEIRESRIAPHSLPNGLLDVGDVEGILHPANYLNSWYRVFEVPPQQVSVAIERICLWIDQLGAAAVLAIPDSKSASSGWGVVTSKLLAKRDNDLFSDLWAQGRIAQWGRDGALGSRLMEQIDLLERTGSHSLKIDEEFLPAVELPSIDRKHFKTKRAAKWIRDTSRAADNTNALSLDGLDYLFSLYSRFANLLDWPQLYPSARRILEDESRSILQLPLSQALPFDPISELQAFLKRQEGQFPVLGYPALGSAPQQVRAGET